MLCKCILEQRTLSGPMQLTKAAASNLVSLSAKPSSRAAGLLPSPLAGAFLGGILAVKWEVNEAEVLVVKRKTKGKNARANVRKGERCFCVRRGERNVLREYDPCSLLRTANRGDCRIRMFII